MSKKDIFLVLKKDDLVKYLEKQEIESLRNILKKIEKGRKTDGKNPANKYYVCNMDEPYSQEVYDTILIGEARKNGKL